MKTRFYWMISLLLLVALGLAACGGDTAAPVAEPAVEAPVVEEEAAPPAEVEEAEEETVVEEVVAEVEEVTAVTDADLDAAFADFLGRMVAYNTIRPDGLNEALVESPPFILDVRQPQELVDNGYIEGAVHIPLRELADNLDLLPAFDEPIVAYCGVGWRCTIAMTQLGALGWTNVKALVGGSFGGWVEAGFPVIPGPAEEAPVLNAAQPDPALAAHAAEVLANLPEGWGVVTPDDLATALVENPEIILIDARTAEEVESNGYIEHTEELFIPLEAFIAEKAQWPADKDANIVIYCGSGHRSTIAMTILYNYGYTNVRSMKGGLAAWTGAGYPVAGGGITEADLDTAFSDFLGRMVAYNTIQPADLNLALAEDPPPFVLDVRQPQELEDNGHIEGAVHIPLRELGDNLDLLPDFDTPIVTYCGVGWRCTIAMTQLGALGWTNVKALVGGSFGGWVEAGFPVIPGPAEEAVVLDVAEPNALLMGHSAEVLANLPDGWGVVTVDDLATELLEKPDLFLIDVRRAEELVENGIIEHENQVNIPLESFIENKAEWPADKDAEIVVYCGSGHRSTIAMTMLYNYGYTNVRSMKGGLNAWTTAGYPVVDAQ